MVNFAKVFDAVEMRLLRELDSPHKIQVFLDTIPYSAEPVYRCPRSVIRDWRAHCFDGAVFAAAALLHLGEPPLILDMTADNDDEHMLALFRRRGYWGAVAKSNFVGLRFREPIHRTVRELVMTYFEGYFNTGYQKTLRGYTLPLNLRAFGTRSWLLNDATMARIATHTDRMPKLALLGPEMVRDLQAVDERSYHAGMLGTDPAGVYQAQLSDAPAA
jgi:hypothetical protein